MINIYSLTEFASVSVPTRPQEVVDFPTLLKFIHKLENLVAQVAFETTKFEFLVHCST